MKRITDTNSDMTNGVEVISEKGTLGKEIKQTRKQEVNLRDKYGENKQVTRG